MTSRWAKSQHNHLVGVATVCLFLGVPLATALVVFMSVVLPVALVDGLVVDLASYDFFMAVTFYAGGWAILAIALRSYQRRRTMLMPVLLIIGISIGSGFSCHALKMRSESVRQTASGLP